MGHPLRFPAAIKLDERTYPLDTELSVADCHNEVFEGPVHWSALHPVWHEIRSSDGDYVAARAGPVQTTAHSGYDHAPPDAHVRLPGCCDGRRNNVRRYRSAESVSCQLRPILDETIVRHASCHGL